MISQGLALVTTSAICESIASASVVSSVSEDYEAGDGMGATAGERRRSAGG
jgi:hypothetical protein